MLAAPAAADPFELTRNTARSVKDTGFADIQCELMNAYETLCTGVPERKLALLLDDSDLKDKASK